MLSITNLACFKGDTLLFKNLNRTISGGEILHVTGLNGSGKTTLLRTLCGLTKPDEGSIGWDHTDILKDIDQYHSKLLYIGHNNGLKDDLTPIENLITSSCLDGYSVDESTVLKILDQFGLKCQSHLPIRVLSQGQKRRVALIRMALTEARLWILDEPFTAVDRHAINYYLDLIKNHALNDGIVILTTHQKIALDNCHTLDMQAYKSSNHV